MVIKTSGLYLHLIVKYFTIKVNRRDTIPSQWGKRWRADAGTMSLCISGGDQHWQNATLPKKSTKYQCYFSQNYKKQLRMSWTIKPTPKIKYKSKRIWAERTKVWDLNWSLATKGVTKQLLIPKICRERKLTQIIITKLIKTSIFN